MASNLNGLNFLDRALLGGKFLNRGLQARPKPLGPGPSPAPAGLTTASAPGRGLGFNPLSPGRSAAAGGLQGLSQLLAQLAAGQPQNAAAAFGAGVEGFQEQEARKADRARQDQLFGLELEDRDLKLQDRQKKIDDAARIETLIDSLDIPEDQKTLMRTGLADYGDLNPKDTWEIKTIREGDQDVTYRINPKTGIRERLGSGLAFKPGTDRGNSLSIAAPVWGMDKDGNPVLLQMSGSGEAVQTRLPEGVTPIRPNVSVDTGTGTAMVSPITGQASNVIPKDIAGKESAEVQGAAQGQAIVDLPSALAKADEARGQIKKLKEHPGRGYATGKSSYLPVVGGTAAKDFTVLLDQLKGGTFLQAYQQLKGGGAITEVEGKKAEQAIARMDVAQTEGEFLAALDEYDAIIAAGTERLKARAGKGGTPYAQSPQNVPPPPAGFVVMQ